jgi:hypothetical protein
LNRYLNVPPARLPPGDDPQALLVRANGPTGLILGKLLSFGWDIMAPWLDSAVGPTIVEYW